MGMNHIIQTPDTCMSACMAMITNQTLEEVIKDFHVPFMENEMQASDYLESKGLKVTRLTSEFTGWHGNHIYVILVPSLNLEAELHSLVFDLRNPKEAILLDPNQGRENKKYYVKYNDPIENDLQVPLQGYVLSLKVE